MDFGTGAGDLANPLAIDPQTGENFGHPSLETGAQLQVDGVTLDQRFPGQGREASAVSVTTDSPPTSAGSAIPARASPIPMIKNEELILLRAEANIGLANLGAAVPDINLVREQRREPSAARRSGHDRRRDHRAAVQQALLPDVRGGHSWIDARRYGRLSTLPVDRPDDLIFPTLPIPTAETLPRQ